jgi:hypothetical protein
MSDFDESPINNTASMGHGGNLFPEPEATPEVGQSLSELMNGSNHSNTMPLVSILTQIFNASQSPPFTGLESTGILNFMKMERGSLFGSFGNMRSFLALPGFGAKSGRGK